MHDPFDAAWQAITDKTARVGVIGLGYVGLPLARAFADKGFHVLGFDNDPDKIARLQRGDSYIGHVASDVLADLRERRLFEATGNFERLHELDVLSICVPTPLTETRDPDLRFVETSARAVADRLRPGQLVILESTTYPGTTRQVVLPFLEAGGLKVGRDFFLAFSPEREDPGNLRYAITNIPKVLGGIEPRSLELAAHFYEQITVQVARVSSTEVAEACKILENTYRDINIALVNELKMLFDGMGIDIWEVIEAARTKPFGFQAFYPGPGLGGPCIPKDPLYLTWIAHKFDLPTRFIELATEINSMMPSYVVGKLADALNLRKLPLNGSKIALLGMAYKKDVGDPRAAPGFAILDLLLRKQAVVTYNDPHIPRLPAMRHYPELPTLESQPLTATYMRAQDAIVIVTDHSAYDWPWIVEHSALIVDTRNATRGITQYRERIVRA